jgi:hypothetical protein
VRGFFWLAAVFIRFSLWPVTVFVTVHSLGVFGDGVSSDG